ncbi:MAG: hypothetical protein J6J91_04810 [Alistipes sp.]|nr:hypothetical protein [Alistipes sp.]
MGDIKGGAKITAAIAADDTRTSLEKVDGKFEVRWSAGDQLGVYGVGANTLNNAAFVLDNASDGKAVGVFASQNTELKADKNYVAVYPRFQEGLIKNGVGEVKYPNPAGAATPEADDVIKSAKYEDVVLKIPATQKYQNGSFYTQTVPSVSSTFVVNTDGGAEVSMQPVVDYVMVNLLSTEPIYTLELELVDKATNKRFQIAGEGNLQKYVLGGEYRYFLNYGADTYAEGADNTVIKLEVDEAYAAVACHKANTYVFTVPANILGKGIDADVRAILTINGGNPEKSKRYILTSDDSKIGKTDKKGDTFYFDNWLLNYKLKDATKKDEAANRVARGGVATTARTDDQALPLENTIFWMNPISVDTDGDKVADARGSFVYNPYGDAIISNEVELLEYIHKYNAGTKVDAFLCEDGSFDFSLTNMMELATEYENTKYEPYIAAYLADVAKGGGFPCFDNYTNNFIGNGAVIENIEQPLLSPFGIFGGYENGERTYNNLKPVSTTPMTTRGGEYVETENGKASITNITFANINAWTYTDKWNVKVAGIMFECIDQARGHILAHSFDNGTIKNVTVKDANGESIIGKADVALYKGLTIEGVSNLANIFDEFVVNDNIDLSETWADVAGVQENVFEVIMPSKNAKGKDALHVITIDEGDASTYKKLNYDVDNDGKSAVAVVINDVSYWTGGKFATPINDDNCVDKNADTKVYYVMYAEQLAYDNTEANIQLTRDIDLNYDNLAIPVVNRFYGLQGYHTKNWTKVAFASIDGANHSIKNVVMVNPYGIKEIAPFNAPVVKNLTLDNVYIDLATSYTYLKYMGKDENGENKYEETTVQTVVPQYVSGLTVGKHHGRVDNNKQTVISNVTVNGLTIDTYRADGTNNTEANYSDEYVTKIGWLVANANNAQISNATVNGVSSTAKGIAGLVAENSIYTSSKFENVSVANVESVNAAIENFAKWNPSKLNYNVMGTVVGLVHNEANREADIKFMNCNAPVFLYDAPATLTVIYDNAEKGSLHN